MAENEQFSHSSVDSVRRELDGKIEGKLSQKMAMGVIVILVTIAVAAFSILYAQIYQINDKLSQVTNRLTIIETKMDERKK